MFFYYVLATIFLLIGLWNLLIAVLGLFSNCRASTVGVLTKAKTYKNVPVSRYVTYPIYTEFEYVYKVKGKEYKYFSFVGNRKKTVMHRTTMVFVKYFPKHAYPNKFKGTYEWLFGIMMLIFGILFIYIITLN